MCRPPCRPSLTHRPNNRLVYAKLAVLENEPCPAMDFTWVRVWYPGYHMGCIRLEYIYIQLGSVLVGMGVSLRKKGVS